jgi:hypothetical protein
LENISMGIPIRQMLNVEATERVGGPDQKDTMTVDSADSQTPRITNSINARPSGEERREPGPVRCVLHLQSRKVEVERRTQTRICLPKHL